MLFLNRKYYSQLSSRCWWIEICKYCARCVKLYWRFEIILWSITKSWSKYLKVRFGGWRAFSGWQCHCPSWWCWSSSLKFFKWCGNGTLVFASLFSLPQPQLEVFQSLNTFWNSNIKILCLKIWNNYAVRCVVSDLEAVDMCFYDHYSGYLMWHVNNKQIHDCKINDFCICYID